MEQTLFFAPSIFIRVEVKKKKTKTNTKTKQKTNQPKTYVSAERKSLPFHTDAAHADMLPVFWTELSPLLCQAVGILAVIIACSKLLKALKLVLSKIHED